MTFHFHSLSSLDPSTLPPCPILRNHSALPLPPHLHHPYPFSPVDISELWTKVVYTFILTRYMFTLHTQSQKKVLYIFKDLKHYHLDIIRGAIIASPLPPPSLKEGTVPEIWNWNLLAVEIRGKWQRCHILFY